MQNPLTFIKLLAHNLRWDIIQSLVLSDARVNELVEITGQPMNLVSYHLKQLRDAHIVHARRSEADGRDVYYRLDIDRLRALYRATGLAIHPTMLTDAPAPTMAGPPRRVLFLCLDNSVRSQMAEGFLRQMGGGQFEVYSAGSDPTSLRPEAIEVMKNAGVAIHNQTVNHTRDYIDQSFDDVITICDRIRDTCPHFGDTTRYIHWGYPTPRSYANQNKRREAYQQIAEQLQARVQHYIEQVQQEALNVLAGVG
jgi:ArsR family transcriptional regulator, arsenate/arsenite/antimonite-responsive transcriptional repressor / arsenate reductase (thioredoxin)